MRQSGLRLLGHLAALAIVALPLSIDLTPIGLDSNAALARNAGGNGNGNGNAGGHAGGKGGTSGKSGDASIASSDDGDIGHGKSKGLGHAKAKGLGHTKDRSLADDDDAPLGAGLTASSLGRLNAAHASDTARANAAPNSAVGQIAAFGDALEAGDIEAAAEALANAANKSIDAGVVSATAGLMGIDVDQATAEAVADAAN